MEDLIVVPVVPAQADSTAAVEALVASEDRTLPGMGERAVHWTRPPTVEMANVVARVLMVVLAETESTARVLGKAVMVERAAAGA